MNGKRLFVLALSAVLSLTSVAAAQENAEASMTEAKKLYRSGDYRGAIQELNRALVVSPERADALYLVGYSHLMLREYPESVEAFSRAFAADPAFDPRTIYQRTPQEPT